MDLRHLMGGAKARCRLTGPVWSSRTWSEMRRACSNVFWRKYLSFTLGSNQGGYVSGWDQQKWKRKKKKKNKAVVKSHIPWHYRRPRLAKGGVLEEKGGG